MTAKWALVIATQGMNADWGLVIATLMAPLVAILIAAVTALWTVKTWRDDREKQRKEEQRRLAALYINPFLIACEGLQSRLYNIIASRGLVALKKGYPEGNYAEDILYFIVQYFGWQQIIYRYKYDRRLIEFLEELREAFATDRRYGGVGPFCFFRSQQRAFGELIMSRTQGPFGYEFVTKDYNQFLEMRRSDPFARSKSVQDTLETLGNAEAASDIPLGVRERLVRIQNLLVDLLDDFEKKEHISYFTKEGGREKASLD